MADIEINVRGDGSEGAGAMREAASGARELAGEAGKLDQATKKGGETARNSVAEWAALSGQIKSTAGVYIDFLVDSAEAAAEAERAERQLELVTGDLAGAFKQTAADMQDTLGVSDEMVMRMEALAYRYEVLPTQIEPATRAIIDWAAATGGDAESGMQMLTRSIEFGTGKIKGLGIEIEITGDKTRDMEAAIAALSKKFGGSGEAMADTASGRTAKLSEAFGSLKEEIGNTFLRIDAGLGIVDKLTVAVKNLIANLKDGTQIASNFFNFDWGDWLAHSTGGAGAPFKALAAGTVQFDSPELADPVDGVRAAGKITKTTFGSNKTDKKASKAAEAALRKLESQHADNSKSFTEIEDEKDAALQLRSENRAREHNERVLREEQEANARLIEEAEQADKEEAKRAEKKMEEYEERNARLADQETRHLKHLRDIQERESKKQEKAMKDAGNAVGMAFVQALGDALSQAIDGGEADATEIAIDTSFSILSAVGGALASYYGGPVAGAAVGTGLGLLGKLAKKDYVSRKRPKTAHDGAWIERYHSGGWPGVDEVPALLQTGERVLSRMEVNRMGGPAGVDQAARGSGGVRAIHVSTLDSESFTDYLGDRGGRGFFNTLRTGRGTLADVFGGG